MIETSNEILLGHEAKWRALRRAFGRSQVPQSLLITGPMHVGKWTLATRYAQLLLCPQASENLAQNAWPAPCGTCRVCHQITIEIFPDFRVYRPTVTAANAAVAPEALDSSIISIEGARRFFEEAAYRPTNGARKVMLIQQADRMNEQAQNALLKTFEEPIAGVTVILLTDQPLRLRETIRSRCWELRLGLVSQREIRGWLQRHFADLSSETLERILVLAGGRPGRAWQAALRQRALAESGQSSVSRLDEITRFVQRIETGTPVAALGLGEDALKLAEAWGEEDQINRVRDAPLKGEEEKKLARTLTRAQITRFLDELALAYRARWHQTLRGHNGNRAAAQAWGDGLDQIRKTRHYILRNANTNLALDVLFSQLIAAQPGQRRSKSAADGPGSEHKNGTRHP